MWRRAVRIICLPGLIGLLAACVSQPGDSGVPVDYKGTAPEAVYYAYVDEGWDAYPDGFRAEVTGAEVASSFPSETGHLYTECVIGHKPVPYDGDIPPDGDGYPQLWYLGEWRHAADLEDDFTGPQCASLLEDPPPE